MKPKYRIRFFMSSVAGRWFSVCYFIRGDKEIRIRGSIEPYAIIGPNNSMVYDSKKFSGFTYNHNNGFGEIDPIA